LLSVSVFLNTSSCLGNNHTHTLYSVPRAIVPIPEITKARNDVLVII